MRPASGPENLAQGAKKKGHVGRASGVTHASNPKDLRRPLTNAHTDIDPKSFPKRRLDFSGVHIFGNKDRCELG